MFIRDVDILINQKPQDNESLKLYKECTTEAIFDHCFKVFFWIFIWSCTAYGLFCISYGNLTIIEQQQKYLIYTMLIFGIVVGINLALFLFVPSTKAGILGYTLMILLIISNLVAFSCLYSYLSILYPLFGITLLMLVFYLIGFQTILYFGVLSILVPASFLNDWAKSWWFWIFILFDVILYFVFNNLFGEYDVEISTIQILIYCGIQMAFIIVVAIVYISQLAGHYLTYRIDEVPVSVFQSMMMIQFWPLTFIGLVFAILFVKEKK